MTFQHLSTISDNIIELFRNHTYEKYVLEIMNESKIIFPESYREITDQSHGECDFISIKNNEKFDAKLPFLPNQIEMLTTGKKHVPQIREWITEMHDEAADFNPIEIRDNPDYDIANTKLYIIMKNAIVSDKPDESIIFFLPYPMVLSISDSIFLQFTTDYLKAIYDRLQTDIDLCCRHIYVIYPASEKNQFAIRNLKSYRTEYLYYDKLEPYFSYEIVSCE